MHKFLDTHPMLYPVFGFLILITVGTILLLLPFASTNGLSFADALFMATSASCVNGLSTISVGNDLTVAGQGIIMVLMKIGGLGIMTISTVIMLIAHSKMNFGQQSAFMSSYSAESNTSIGYVVKRIIIVTLAVEMLGAAVLYTQFDNLPQNERIFASVFHAISAFCNAGFSFWNNSMQSFAMNPVVNFALMFLIICGGIGFLSLSEIVSFKRNKVPGRTLTLHTRLVLLVSFILIAAGTLLMLVTEWNNSLGGLPFADKVLASLFQSVTARSAGFSTVDFSMLGVPMLFLIILLMFIGASPGSCGGGIKTTTAAIMVLLGINRFLGRDKVQVFNRSIPAEIVEKSMRIFILSMVVIAVASFLLFSFETVNLTAKEEQSRFLELLFETVSAFSTCGLSMGITDTLTVPGKILLSIVMFVGRLGPLVLVQAVIRKSSSGAYYAEEPVMVG